MRVALDPAIYRITIVHLIVDGYGNIYAPLLPLLIPHLDLSLAAAGTLAMCFQIAAAVTQPGFGQLADRWNPRPLLMAGPVVAVIVLSLVGRATDPVALGAILVAGGLGCAAFHPPAAVLAHRLGGLHKGLAVSVYISGGTLGFALGPLLFAPVAERFGLQATPLLALPGLLVVALLLRRTPSVPIEAGTPGRGFGALRPYAKPLGLLYLIVVLRTVAALSFLTFVPTMLTARGTSLGEAGAIVAAFLVASGVGGFLGGPAADRYGARRVIIWSLLLSAPALALAPLTSGSAFVVLLSIGGFFLQSTLPVNITFAQTIAPVSAATVSSLMMGFGWGSGGLGIPLVGMLADRIGIEGSLMLMSVMPLLAAACAWPLPGEGPPHAPPHPAGLGIPEPT